MDIDLEGAVVVLTKVPEATMTNGTGPEEHETDLVLAEARSILLVRTSFLLIKSTLTDVFTVA